MYEITCSLNFSEYALKVKSEILSCENYIPKINQQEVALKVFIEGLNDKNVSNAIKLQNPKSINEALNSVKHIKAQQLQIDDANINFMRKDKFQVSEIDELKKQVAYLTQLVISFPRKLSSSVDRNNVKGINENQKKFCEY